MSNNKFIYRRLLSPPYVNMSAIPYRSALRDPQGKAEPTIEELETIILSDKAYAMGFLKCLKYRKHTYHMTPNLSCKTPSSI
ncbi:hypothetical protein H8356DRAFT_1361441 [Neocallimastix lanati (nom. inval.)]|nr:hypothetical protein H8356DRAFT_1361441 [Neocallimastix sp. JGI-2020a]